MADNSRVVAPMRSSRDEVRFAGTRMVFG